MFAFGYVLNVVGIVVPDTITERSCAEPNGLRIMSKQKCHSECQLWCSNPSS